MRAFFTFMTVLFAMPFTAEAQHQLRRFELKIYSNHSITWTPLYGLAGQQHAHTSTKFFQPSFGLAYTTGKGYFFEAEVNGLGSHKSVSNMPASGPAPAIRSESSSSTAGFRLEAGRMGKSYRQGAWRFMYSLALLPFYSRDFSNTAGQEGLTRLTKTWNADVQFVPRLQYQISRSCRLDMNLPFTMTRFAHRTEQWSCPHLCDGGASRRTNAEILPSVLSFRAGLAFRL